MTAPRFHALEAQTSLARFAKTTVKPTDRWNHPDHAHETTGTLVAVAELLARGIEQTGALIGRLDVDGKLTHDQGDLPAALEEIRILTDDAAGHAEEMAKTLKRLESVLARLGHRN